MSISDGSKENICTREFGEEINKRISLEEYQNTADGAGFRGFEKVPLVLVSPYDITPYLRTSNYSSIKRFMSKKSTDGSIAKHLERLSQKCTINLVRHDLEDLKREFSKKATSKRHLSSESDSGEDEMSDIKCKICYKGYSSEKKMIKHQVKKHMIVYKSNSKPQKRVSFSDKVIIHEVTEYHKCRKCTKIFEAYIHLKTHMKLCHKKRKCYVCNYCSKKFADRTIFKVHMKLHCDNCGLLLPNKVSYTEHRRNVCRIVKYHKCKMCEEVYFSLLHLKDHSYEHGNMCYVCDICKDQFKTKCEVAHHISFLHSKRRPTSLYEMLNLGNERLYLCNFCDDTSVEREPIEKHVQLLPDLTNRAMTGYKDYYFCDQCLKKFGTETEMLQHKWTHFLKASDNSQERNEKRKLKMTYKINEEIPEYMKPQLILEKIQIPKNTVKKIPSTKIMPTVKTMPTVQITPDNLEFIDIHNFDITTGVLKKPIVDPISKKTIISKYRCPTCGKYYSSNYCLNRHIEKLHMNYNSLQCKVCEETFVWPSLLRSHKCLRLQHPEMPFQDARPEIHFDNLNELNQSGFDDLNIDNDDYINSVDFEIPAPIVELTEYEGFTLDDQNKFAPLQNLGYKLVMQEVPIEF